MQEADIYNESRLHVPLEKEECCGDLEKAHQELLILPSIPRTEHRNLALYSQSRFTQYGMRHGTLKENVCEKQRLKFRTQLLMQLSLPEVANLITHADIPSPP